MNELDQLLQQIGLTTETNRNAVKGQILAYGLERATALLIERGELTADDKAHLQQAFANNQINDAELQHVFGAPERQKVLQQAMSEAVQLVVDAAQEPPKASQTS